MTSGLIKTSAVLIGVEDRPMVYRSVQEVPEPWRGRLIESTNSRNAATIVIADHGGRKHIAEAVRRNAQAAAGQPVAAPPMEEERESAPAVVEPLGTPRNPWVYAIALLLALMIMASTWLLYTGQW